MGRSASGASGLAVGGSGVAVGRGVDVGRSGVGVGARRAPTRCCASLAATVAATLASTVASALAEASRVASTADSIVESRLVGCIGASRQAIPTARTAVSRIATDSLMARPV